MNNKEKNFISAVVYVHNAEEKIVPFLQMLIAELETNFEHSEIICVNDFSEDDSVQKIKEISIMAKETSLSVLNMSSFHGVELSMNAGVDLAIGDFVYEFDSAMIDYEAGEIMRMYWESLKGFDIVSASPDRKQKFSSRMFYKLFDQFTDASYKMTTERFRILSRRVINRISSMNKSVPYRKAVYMNCGLKTKNVIYQSTDTEIHTDSKETKYRRRLATDTLILFTDVGYRFSMTMTAVMMLMTAVMIIYTIVTYAVSTPVEGWTTTLLFLSLAFFGLFGILTIIIKYLQLLVELVFKRKNYSFESIEKLTK